MYSLSLVLAFALLRLALVQSAPGCVGLPSLVDAQLLLLVLDNALGLSMRRLLTSVGWVFAQLLLMHSLLSLVLSTCLVDG